MDINVSFLYMYNDTTFSAKMLQFRHYAGIFFITRKKNKRNCTIIDFLTLNIYLIYIDVFASCPGR